MQLGHRNMAACQSDPAKPHSLSVLRTPAQVCRLQESPRRLSIDLMRGRRIDLVAGNRAGSLFLTGVPDGHMVVWGSDVPVDLEPRCSRRADGTRRFALPAKAQDAGESGTSFQQEPLYGSAAGPNNPSAPAAINPAKGQTFP